MHAPAPIRLADGAHAITRLLRERLPLRQGQALLSDAGEPLLLMDLEHDQAVLLQEPAAALVERLADAFERLQLDALTPARLQAWPASGHASHCGRCCGNGRSAAAIGRRWTNACAVLR
jgi:hypothetical protein